MTALMFQSWFLIAVALGYVGALFAVAWIGDRAIRLRQGSAGRPVIYALSITVYCTSWTFFGSVGLASQTGYDFIPVYLGPIIVFTAGYPLLLKIIRLAKRQNLTSVADFMAARYGKSQLVAAVVTLVMVIGTLPYMALQLKAVSVSIETLLGGGPLVHIAMPSIASIDTAFLITLSLAAFAILFGTRHSDATEHQDGLVIAIAVESVVKLAALTAVGLFVVFVMFDGPAGLWQRAALDDQATKVFSSALSGGRWLTITLLSAACVVLLPRQFHVTVVENNSERELRYARWMFPLYLILINLFVIPIAIAGLVLMQRGIADPDFFVLTVPLRAGSHAISLIAFVGGLSAATAMVIVEAVALSIMVSNGLVLPLLLRQRLLAASQGEASGTASDLSGVVLLIRRLSILLLLLLAYGVYRALAQSESLVSIGLISFAAIAQVAPAFFGGLIWREATARGAIAGTLAGLAVWTYTLLLPWIAKAGYIPGGFVRDGPFDIAALRPEALLFLQFDPLSHAVFWSLGANIVAFVVVSALQAPEPIERLQAQIFVPDETYLKPQTRSVRRWRTTLTMDDLERTAARYLGVERARRSFAAYAARRHPVPGVSTAPKAEADIQAVRFTEHLLTSAVGAASARLIMSLQLRQGDVSPGSALRLLDDANEALQFNRDLLQSALDQVRHGLAVFDKDMRLICWNRQFRELLNLPDEMMQLGVPLDALLRVSAARAGLESPMLDTIVGDRVLKLAVSQEIYHERELAGDYILEVRTSPMPLGGIVITFSDITHRVQSDAALARVNETLERRVQERTVELLAVNRALGEAKAAADAASLDKTRFIAAASHDILQPLNAARLYAASLGERQLAGPESHLVRNLDASLQAVEEIFAALIDMSRMDAGRLEPDIETFPLAPLLDQLRVEFEPTARAKGLDLAIVQTAAWVRSDRRLLRRVLQNLLANAIKYTTKGRVLAGARRRGGTLVIGVYDTGPGIAGEHQALIFKEFQRLDETAGVERGVGLGLSIVERVCKVLGARLELVSRVGHGSMFAVYVPRVANPVPALNGRSVLGSAPVPGSFEGIRVLCLDNEAAVLAGMEALLKGWNCTIETTASADAVLLRRMGFPVSRSLWPDVILADYHLDHGTGIEAIARLRAAARWNIPAIVITADQSTLVQREIRNCGHTHLKKPIKPAALRAALSQALIRRHDALGEAAPSAAEASG
jgi:Na+/proline symporter/signal transduction histidine kinase/CheY-like chemotaxis protein